MESAQTVITFVAGLVLGGVAVYLTPPVTESEVAPCTSGLAGEARPGIETALTPDRLPAAVGAPTGAPVMIPGTPGTVPSVMPEAPPTPPPETPSLVGDGAVAQAMGLPPQAAVGTLKLDAHLATAREKWTALADRSNGGALASLAPAMREMAASVPSAEGMPPPLQSVVAYLVAEDQLLTRILEAGGDAGDLGQDVKDVLTLDRGRIPGGAQTRYEHRDPAGP